MKGFTLLETILAMTIISAVSVASVYMLYLSLNLRDLTLATTKTEESLRVFNLAIRNATLGAISISGGGDALFLRGKSECWSFVYDSGFRNVRYSKISQPDCNPDPSPLNIFFPTSTKINSLVFRFTPLSTGGRQVSVNGQMQTILPFDVYQTDFSNSYVNLVD